jgi:hypothetical protein
VPAPAYAIDYSPADLYGANGNGNGSGNGTGSLIDGGFGGTGNGNGNGSGGDDIIELGGHGGDQA